MGPDLTVSLVTEFKLHTEGDRASPRHSLLLEKPQEAGIAGILKANDLSSVSQVGILPLLFAVYLVPLTTSAFFKLLCLPHGKLHVLPPSQSSFAAGSSVSTQTPLISTST